VDEHLFQPGNKEGKGRIPGRPNRRTFELQQRLRDRGDIDPADFLSSIVTSDKESTELKCAAANYLLPYLDPERGAVPTPRFIAREVDVSEFTNVSEAESFLAKIAILCARGELDIQQAQELAGIVKTWIDTQYDRENLQLKISPPETHDQKIVISGGLPALPGSNITMPVLNGHAVQEQLLSAPADVVPSDPPENEFPTPGELKAQGPHPLQPRHFADTPAQGQTQLHEPDEA